MAANNTPIATATAAISPPVNKFDKAATWLVVSIFFFMTGSKSITVNLAFVALLIFLFGGQLKEKMAYVLSNRMSQAMLALFAIVTIIGLPRHTDWATYFGALKGYYPLLTAPFFTWYLRTHTARQQAIWAFIAGVSVTIVFMFVDATVGNPLMKISELNGAQRHVAFFNHTTQGVLLALVVVTCVWVQQTCKKAWLGWLAMGVALAAVVANFGISTGRTGYLATAAALPFLLASYMRGKQVVLAIATAIALTIGMMVMQPEVVTDRLQTTLAEVRDFQSGERAPDEIISNSAGFRLLQLEKGLAGAAEKPIFGWGLGACETAFYAVPGTEEYKNHAVSFEHPHNQFLLLLVETGLVGLAGMLALFIWPSLKLLGPTSGAPANLQFIWLALLAIFASHALLQSVLFVVSDRNIHPMLLSLFYLIYSLDFSKESKSS